MKKSPYIDDEEIYLDIDTLVKIRYTLGCFRLIFQKLVGGNDDEVSKNYEERPIKQEKRNVVRDMMLIKIFELDKVNPRVYMIIVLVITTLIVRVIADAWIKDINKLMTPAA